MNSDTGLACWVVPMESGNMLVPDNLVVEVVMTEDTDTQQYIHWRNRQVPIFQNTLNTKITTRVAVLRTVMGYQDLPFVAVAVNGIPHALHISPDTLSEVDISEKPCNIAASYTCVGSLDCFIPDLPKIENSIRKGLPVE